MIFSELCLYPQRTMHIYRYMYMCAFKNSTSIWYFMLHKIHQKQYTESTVCKYIADMWGNN